MDVNRKIQAFAYLGKVLSDASELVDKEVLISSDRHVQRMLDAIEMAGSGNAWFTPGFISKAIRGIAMMLDAGELQRWVASYPQQKGMQDKTVAVVMAGNIPAVGFHDFLSVLMAGHRLQAKLSSDDRSLIPAMAEVLTAYDAGLGDRIAFTEEKIHDSDAVIATGSNNTARYFDYYFGKYPHIIRRNRNAVAVLQEDSTDDSLKALGEDIFLYFGLGCRNVSKLYLPRGFEAKRLFEALEEWSWIGDHHKYRNNYDYNKSIFLVNGDAHLDNGFLLLKEDAALISPVSVLNFQYYDDQGTLKEHLQSIQDEIQCVVTDNKGIGNGVMPGRAQYPGVDDYADGIDTLAFLTDL